MKKLVLLSLSLSLAACASAKVDLEKEALKLVPNGTVEMREGNEVKVKTAEGTRVEIEFNRDGTLDEASGDMAKKDIFVPGNGLISLKDAVAALEKAGKTPSGDWSLDKDMMRDWEYEFEGVENGREFEYRINAKTGQLVKSKQD